MTIEWLQKLVGIGEPITYKAWRPDTMCPECKSTKQVELFTTGGEGTRLDNDAGDDDHAFGSITMWAHVCPDCNHVVDKGFDA